MKRDEKGIALVITLFLMATLSALAVSLTFLSQTETASSRNYRTMSQARYAGEAGVHKAINHLMYGGYNPPASPFTGFGTTKSPVTCTSGCTHTTAGTCDASTVASAVSTGCIVLSGISGVSSNYPDSTVASAFSTAAQGTMAVNGSGTTSNAALGTVTYGAAAILMSMRPVASYGGSSSVVQTWQIVAEGTVPGSQPATVEVTASLERQITDAQTFAVFATGTGCGAITLNGNVSTASYDSTSGSSATTTTGGNVGTNGNLNIVGHVDVHGTLSSPRTGVGSCTNGTNVTALTTTGAATVDDADGDHQPDLIRLPQAMDFPAPALPNPLPPTTSMSNCASIGLLPPATCTTSSGKIVIDPMGTTVTLGNISGNFVLKGGNYNINSVGSGDITVQNSALGTANVVINLAGKSSTGTDLANPFNLNGNDVINPSMDPARLQVLYAGTGAVDLTGGSQAAMMLYAPNATVTTHGNADIYGSILARQVTSAGTPRFIYDRSLQSRFFALGNFVMTSFSWKKY